MCKFYQIASNSLQVIHIVHELFDYPSYLAKIPTLQFININISAVIKRIFPLWVSEFI